MKLDVEVIDRTREGRTTDSLLGDLPQIWPGDRGTDWWRAQNEYAFRYALGRILRPHHVFEIGVRIGYSLVALLRGHPDIESITGVDVEGFIPNSNAIASNNLRVAGYEGKLKLHRLDSLTFVPGSSMFDFIHVDGAHTYEAARHDMALSWRMLDPGGVMVVDDTTYHMEVKAACDHAKPKLVDLDHSFFYPSFRGCWIARKRGK